MSRPKVRKPKDHITLTRKDLERYQLDQIQKAFILTAAYLMDDFDYDEARILDFWNGVVRYADAIDSKLISLQTVTQIIEEHTGLKLGKWE